MKTQLIAAVALAVLLSSGCAGSQLVSTKDSRAAPKAQIFDATYLADAPGTGEVVIKRDWLFHSSWCNTRVYIDAKSTAEIGAGEKIVLHLPPGEHMFAVVQNDPCWGSLTETHSTVRAGELITLRVGYSSTAGFFIAPTAF